MYQFWDFYSKKSTDDFTLSLVVVSYFKDNSTSGNFSYHLGACEEVES